MQGVRSLSVSLFWAFATLLDQVNELRPGRTSNNNGDRDDDDDDSDGGGDFMPQQQHQIQRCIVIIVLLLSLFVTNFYRAELNANFISAEELKTNWTRLEQIKNFTLYFVVGEKFIEEAEKVRGRDRDRLEYYDFNAGCVVRDGTETEVDGAFCSLSFHGSRLYYMSAFDQACAQPFLRISNGQEPEGAETVYGKCKNKDVNVFLNIMKNTKFLNVTDLDRNIEKYLTEPSTALVTNEEYFPKIWPKFQEVKQRTHGRIKFAHNLDAQLDKSFGGTEQKIIIGSGMGERSFTDLVGNRARALVSSGLWKEWIRLETFHQSREFGSASEKSKRAEFSQLSINHDGIWLIFMIFLALHAMACACFVIAKGYQYVRRFSLGVAKYARELWSRCGKQSEEGSAGKDNEIYLH